MINASVNVPNPYNEPVLNYEPGSKEKKELKSCLGQFSDSTIDIPLIIGGSEVRTGDCGNCLLPHNHHHSLGTYHKGNTELVNKAIKAATKAKPEWMAMPWEARASIFLKAADLLARKYRPMLNAATMLNQSKTVLQAEIDAACELIDFYRYNPFYMQQIFKQQPRSMPGIWNYLEYRPLEGFVFAVTPFNFTSIAGNLPTAPAMMGNTVVWKPASTAVYSAYLLMQLFAEAGLPDGVINLIPGDGAKIGNPVMNHPDLGGVHFTGSTEVFQGMWRAIGNNIATYKSYPRIVGETGGKNFIFAHASADLDSLITNTIRGAYEYQGQKCSAVSRAYIPKSLWKSFSNQLSERVNKITYGDITDFRHFMGAVIDRTSYNTIKDSIEAAKTDTDANIICGGNYDDRTGYFISPTVIEAHDPYYKTMQTEIFGPVLTIYVYPDQDYEKTLQLCDSTSPYGLTGSIFACDRKAINEAYENLRNSAGNFYINDKPTGAVVGQQPFGGSRASGTNDKAGSHLNLIRWTSPRTIKETFTPTLDYRYPHMKEE